MKATAQTPTADLFCRVVDNLGDIGVMWRLARELTQEKGWRIRLWVDRLESFKHIEPAIDPASPTQTCQNIEVRHWPEPWQASAPHSIVIAGFSCELPDGYIRQLAQRPNPIWLQLEYLSAENWVSSFHGLHSKRNDVLKPIFFFPGFNEQTGGLIREATLLHERDHWASTQQSLPWLASIGVKPPEQGRLISVFTYPHAPLHRFIEQLQQTGERFHLLIPSGQELPTAPLGELVTWQAIEFLPQSDYDKLLWSCDLNLVRGEDSFVRAIWAAKPMLWQIYPQKDGAHHAKLDAWLNLAKLPDPAGQVMHEWSDGKLDTDLTTTLTGEGWNSWQHASQAFSASLSQQTDLATRLNALAVPQTDTRDGL